MNAESILLKGENFQAMDKFSVKIHGLTVVVGPTDLGKSALQRALKGVLRNEVSENHIRTGQSKVEVSLISGGTQITATRLRKKSTTYNVDGAEYAKLNQNIPEPMRDLGYGEIEIGTVTIDPLFAKQSDRQFLIDESQSPADLNIILGGFASTERLDKGRKSAMGKVADKNSEAKIIARTIQELEEEAQQIALLKSQADEIQAELISLSSEHLHLSLILTHTKALIESLTSHTRVLKAIASLSIPNLSVADHLSHMIQQLISTARISEIHARYESLLNQVPVVDLKPVTEMILVLKHSLVLHQSLSRVTQCSAAISALTGIEAKFSAIVQAYRIRQYTLNLAETKYSERNAIRSKTRKRLDDVILGVEKQLQLPRELGLTVKYLSQFIESRRAVLKLKESLVVSQDALSEAEIMLRCIEVGQQQDILEKTKIVCPQCGEKFPHSQANH